MKVILVFLLLIFIFLSQNKVSEVKKDINQIYIQDCINVKNNIINKAINADVDC